MTQRIDETGGFSDRRAIELVGHRGAAGLYPENTVAGLLGALSHGVDAVEVDVHVSADGHAVLSHDPWVGKRPIFELAAAELGRAGFPTLRHAMSAVHGAGHRPRWYVEIKSFAPGDRTLHPGPEAFVQAVLSVPVPLDPNRVVILAFDPRIAIEVRRAHPDFDCHLLIDEHPRTAVTDHVRRLGFVPAGLGPHHTLVDRAFVDGAHAEGMRVVPWTVNSADDIRRMVDAGVDGIITDRPDVAAPLLAAHPAS